jgi:cell division protein FtsL
MPAQRLLQSQGIGARSEAVQKKFIKRWAVWFVLATVLCLFYVWSRVQVVRLGYDVSKLKSEAEALNKQVSNLEIEIARLKSPARLEDVAKNMVNMKVPSAEQMILVK